MKKYVFIVLLFEALLYTRGIGNELSMPSVFGSGMVLQRNTEISFWGQAAPEASVKIHAGWGEEKLVTSDAAGKWKASVRTIQAGGPYSIYITSGVDTLRYENVLLGEVWLCSGQSNMEMPVMGWPPTDTILNSEKEIAAADYPEIRLFTVTRNIAPEPQGDCNGAWSVCSPETVSGFSATAYFFGKELYSKLKIPIGLIHSSWGGTPAEAWTPGEYLQRLQGYEGILDSIIKAREQYLVFLEWMGKLDNVEISGNNPDFYPNLDRQDHLFSGMETEDSGWKEMLLPSLWEMAGLPDFDGMVWFRKSFRIPPEMAGKPMVLELGPIDDMDISFINGQEIGQNLELGKWQKNRVYAIPEGLLRGGENILSVCVIDHTGGGGIYSRDDIKITDKESFEIALNGTWKYMPVAQIVGDHVYYFDEQRKFSDRPPLSLVFGPNTPTSLYNAMIHPLVPYTIRGAVWYQGEANVGRGFEYRTLFPLMIRSWRDAFGIGDFPFYFVQIAPWNYSEEEPSPAAEIREAQLMTLSEPNTGMAVTMDIGNPRNIHPANKEDVGKRLAFWALNKTYRFDQIVYSGPLYKSLEIDGSKAVVHFTHTEGGLQTKGKALTHFEIAGKNHIYYPAEAKIEGNAVIVWHEKVSYPVAVRYAWSDDAEPNLFNGAGLPASPFRTDNWKRLSE